MHRGEVLGSRCAEEGCDNAQHTSFFDESEVNCTGLGAGEVKFE